MPDPANQATLASVTEWMREEFNKYISVYEYDDKVRVTNGSAAHYVDIYINDGSSFALEGELYGDTVNTSCNRTKQELLDAMPL